MIHLETMEGGQNTYYMDLVIWLFEENYKQSLTNTHIFLKIRNIEFCVIVIDKRISHGPNQKATEGNKFGQKEREAMVESGMDISQGQNSIDRRYTYMRNDTW